MTWMPEKARASGEGPRDTRGKGLVFRLSSGWTSAGGEGRVACVGQLVGSVDRLSGFPDPLGMTFGSVALAPGAARPTS
jgi:hypothetical protein